MHVSKDFVDMFYEIVKILILIILEVDEDVVDWGGTCKSAGFSLYPKDSNTQSHAVRVHSQG